MGRGKSSLGARLAAPRAAGTAEAEGRYLDFCRERISVDYVEDAAHLQEAIIDVRQAGREDGVALDFEVAMQSSKRHYTDVLRTVQLGVEDSRGARQYVIDCRSVDVSPLRDLFADESLPKLIHSARFEQEWSLTRFGVPIENIYDTCVAMRTIQTHLADMDIGDRAYALERLGYSWAADPQQKRRDLYFGNNTLGATVERVLGFAIPKDEQSGDWGRDRLSRSQLAYATLDAALLGPLSGRLKEIARELGVTAEVTRRIKVDDDKTRERVEREIKSGNVRDDADRALRALEIALTTTELDLYWDSARSLAITAASYARLLRVYEDRRTVLTAGESLDEAFHRLVA